MADMQYDNKNVKKSAFGANSPLASYAYRVINYHSVGIYQYWRRHHFETKETVNSFVSVAE